jgi:hypothetical protein
MIILSASGHPAARRSLSVLCFWIQAGVQELAALAACGQT